MSDNPESASIDLSVNADAALETMSQLANAAKEADADLQRLKTTMASQVNAAFGAAMGTTVDYSHAQNIVRGMQPADIAAALPGVPQIQQQIAERSGVVTGAALDVAGAPGAASQPIPQLLDQVRQLLMAQQAQQQTTAASAPSSATPGALHTSSVAPPSSLYTPASTDATQQDRGANVVGQRIAESLTRYAGGMLTGGIQGGASAAGMGGAGDLVGAVARPLMLALGEAAPLALGAIGLIGGAAGIGLGVNSAQAHYADEQQSLSGAVGTTTGSTPLSVLRSTQNVGWNYLYGEKQSVAAAEQLGQQGVLSNQMPGALNDAMALSRLSGLDLGQTTDLTGGLMKAGASSSQVGDTFAALDEAARHSGVSLDRLVTSLKTLQQAAGASQLDVNGLAATQKMVGPNVQVGQALAPLVGATGVRRDAANGDAWSQPLSIRAGPGPSTGGLGRLFRACQALRRRDVRHADGRERLASGRAGYERYEWGDRLDVGAETREPGTTRRRGLRR